MILACPKCATRYLLDPAALGANGRRVRCAKCGETWHQTAPVEAPPPPPAPEPAAEPRPARRESLAAPRANLPALAPKRRSLAGVGWLLLVLAVAGLLAGGWFGRDAIVAAWPPAANLYAALGLEPPPPKLGLELRNLRSSTATENGGRSLMISGEVVNVTDRPVQLPPVKIGLRDAGRREIRSTTIALEPAEIGPKSTLPFATRLPQIPAEAKDVEVTFAAPAARATN